MRTSGYRYMPNKCHNDSSANRIIIIHINVHILFKPTYHEFWLDYCSWGILCVDFLYLKKTATVWSERFSKIQYILLFFFSFGYLSVFLPSVIIYYSNLLYQMVQILWKHFTSLYYIWFQILSAIGRIYFCSETSKSFSVIHIF